MRILGLGKLHDFCVAHADAKSWIENWIADVRNSSWKAPHEVKQRYASASFLASNIVIFNVRGNNYRLAVQVAYGAKTIAVQWIGTHAEYSRRYR